jgi:hypothetical protein
MTHRGRLIVPNTNFLPQLDGMDRAFDPFDGSWISPNHYPSEYFQSVLPIPCHSHNDYWRRRPLWSALGTGCIGLEADIWLIDENIYVGHTANELDKSKTLSNLYINPLIELLEKRYSAFNPDPGPRRQYWASMPGVFAQAPQQSLTLLLDFKTEGFSLWPAVNEVLEGLRQRGWLTFWNGKSRVERPITVVVTGSAPFSLVTLNTTYHDIFFDAPLEALQTEEDETDIIDSSGSIRTVFTHKYNRSNSHYASSSMTRALGPLWQHSLSQSQLDLMRNQIEQATARGLIPRYWGTPRWPRGLRDSVWEVLLKQGVGILNVDDLRAARKGDWGVWDQPV